MSRVNEHIRLKVLALLSAGELTVADVMRLSRHNVSRPTVDKWVREAGIDSRKARLRRASRVWKSEIGSASLSR